MGMADDTSEQSHHGRGIGYLHNQLPVPFIRETHDDCLIGMADIPEYQLAVIVEGAAREGAWHVRPHQFDTVPPGADLRRVVLHVCDMRQWDRQLASEAPQFVKALDSKERAIAVDRDVNHTTSVLQANLCGTELSSGR